MYCYMSQKLMLLTSMLAITPGIKLLPRRSTFNLYKYLLNICYIPNTAVVLECKDE